MPIPTFAPVAKPELEAAVVVGPADVVVEEEDDVVEVDSVLKLELDEELEELEVVVVLATALEDILNCGETAVGDVAPV
jgi:hypothetical protein